MKAHVPDGVVCLHADSALLVLAKPAGLLSVPGRGPDKQDCLSARVQQQWPDALVVHRLDMATSGLVLMARSAAGQRTLSKAFADRSVEKRYQAVVQGCMEMPTAWQEANAKTTAITASYGDSSCGDWGDIQLPISADWERRPLRVVDLQGGKPSHTRWRVLRTQGFTHTTRLELAPITGRTHQLRVHLAAVGHPILGDLLYGDPAAQAAAPRLLLHATRLAFAHPSSGEWVQFALPPEF